LDGCEKSARSGLRPAAPTRSPRSDGGASVAFYWYGTSPTARQVWLDVSQSLSYWEPGTFTNAGPFGPNDGYYEWRGLPAGSTIYVRVNQQLANGAWDPSETFYLSTPPCGR